MLRDTLAATVAVWGSCAGSDRSPGPGYACRFRVAHSAVPDSTPNHGCARSTGDKERAWFWDIYQPPKAFETAELGTLAECIAKTAGDRPPEIHPGRMSFAARGKALTLTGDAGINAGTFAERLSVSLPKAVAFAPTRTCSRAVAQALTSTRAMMRRCSVLMGGLLDDPAHDFWFAIAGPKRPGGGRQVWLRAAANRKLVGFGTGSLKPAAGGYGQTLVAQLGQLALNAELVGLRAEGLRATGRCAGTKLRYRIELVNDAGTIKTRKTTGCPGGRQPK